MITTKADKLLRSLIDAGLSLTDFTLLAIKALHIQRDFKIDNNNRQERDRLYQQDKIREQYQFEQQLKDEEERRKKGLEKLREIGYIINDNDLHEISNSKDQLLNPYSKEINLIKQKQRDCCLTFNIDYDLRLNQQTLEKACRRAKRNIYELRADRFNRPEYRSVLSVETITLHNKLKETIRGINKISLDTKNDQDKRHFQELLTYINQFEGDIDLLMCQMQYEPKVKETILFSSVTTDILDRMNLILYYVHSLAKQISSPDNLIENISDDINNPLSNIPSKVTYIIKIKTNDELSSSLSDETNVMIKLHGTFTKSPDIRLIQSINKQKWQSGQIDLFNIELNYLGDIYAIDIWHDNQYSSWKVDWIEIIDDAANIYHFPLNRLFDKHSNEKKTRFIIQRDIGPVNNLPIKPIKQIKPYKQIGFSTYTVQVKTGKQPNKVTDSTVFVKLNGDNGSFSDNLCSANSAFKSSVFEPDQLDTFYLVWPDLSKINSLDLRIQSDGIQPSWFCEYITVEDGQTGEKYKFIINQLFDGTNSNLKRQLTVYPEASIVPDKKEEKPSYLLKFKTGDEGLSTTPSINLILKGEKGKADTYPLKSSENKRKLFQANQTDEFILPSKYYIGPIKSLQLTTNDPTDKWFIESIIIRDISKGQDYIFPIYKSMNSKEITAQPINDQKPDYIVYTRTISSDLKGPDRKIKLLIQGVKGKQEIELTNPISMHNSFQPGRKDEFYIDNTKSLGDLQSIEVDITHPNIKKLGLDYIEIKDLSTNNSYRFNINRMLDSKNPKMIAKSELISQSTLNNRNQLPLPQGDKQPSSNSIELKNKETYKIKLKTINKEFRDKNTKLQIELIDEDQQSEGKILNQTDNNIELLQKGKIDTFTIDTKKDFGKLKNIKLSLIDSKSKKKEFYQPEFIEISHPKTNKTYRLEYTKDDILNSDKKRLELTKPIKLRSDTNVLEKTQPQGASPSTTITNKPTKSPYTKLADSILSETNEEDLSFSTDTNPSKEFNSLSDQTSRQIRPGDRVKNNIKKQINNPSLHEVDWYRRSIEINKDQLDEAKQIQLISNKHISQTKFDQQQAYVIKNKSNENQKINREILPKKSSSRSLKQQKTSKIKQSNDSPTPSNSLKPSTTTNKQSKTSDILSQKERSYDQTPSESNIVDTTVEKNDSFFSNQQKTETISTPFKDISRTNTDHPISVSSKSVPPYSRTPSEVPTKRSQSVSSSRTPTNQVLSGKTSSIPSTIFDDQSQQLMNIPSSTPAESHSSQLTTKITANIPTDSFVTSPKVSDENSKENKFKRPQITSSILIEPNFDENNSPANSHTASGVTIHTTATKSDSDSRLTRKSIDSHGSEHSLQSKSLLSPDTAKKSRKNRRREHRQNASKTSGNTQSEQTSIVTSDPSNITTHVSSDNNKFLSKETSNIQYASRPPSNTSKSESISLAIGLKTSDPANEKLQASEDTLSKQYRSYTDQSMAQDKSDIQSTTSQGIKSRQITVESRSDDTNILSQYSSKPSVNTSTTTGASSISTITTQNHSLSNEISDISQSTISTKQSSTSKTSSNIPLKPIEIDHMSTVYEESEPSTISIPNLPTSSLSEHNSKQQNIQSRSNVSSPQQNSPLPHRTSPINNKIKSSSKSLFNKSPTSSTHQKKTIDAKTVKSTTSINYEFRVQTSNESPLAGTTDPVCIEITNTKGNSIKIPLNNSINNSKPFQKGQLDVFHLNIPKDFHAIKKLNFFLPKTTKDPLHIRYCELQDRQTMDTLYFPIEKWLGEKNTYNVEMYINNNNNSV